MPYSKSPEIKPRPAWGFWGARACLFGGALLLFGSLLPPVLTEVNATIRAKAGNIGPSKSSATNATADPSKRVVNTQNAHSKPPQGWQFADRQEIARSYREWKNAWFVRDLDKCMSLYARDIRFSDVGLTTYNYKSLEGWFKNTWGRSQYIVEDREPPRLRIRGNRAVMLTKQSYTTQSTLTFRFTSRYIWEKRAIHGKNKHRWLIVEEAYLPYDDNNASAGQIY